MRYFTFDGQDSRAFGLVLGIDRPFMAEVDPVTVQVPKRAGVYVPKSHSRQIRETIFTVRFGIIGNNNADFKEKLQIFAAWIFAANAEGSAKRLWFSDTPDRYYMAHVSGGADLEEIQATGEVMIDFIAADPFAYSTIDNEVQLPEISANLFDDSMYLDDWQDWYGNMLVTRNIDDKNDTYLRNELIDAEANPRMRLGSGAENRVPFIAGQSYTISFLIRSSDPIALKTIEFLAVYYYEPENNIQQWQSFNNWPLENNKDWQQVEINFTADLTALGRLTMGFGLGNNTYNGAFFDVKNIKIEEGSKTIYTKKGAQGNYGAEINYQGSARSFPVYEIAVNEFTTQLKVKNNSEKMELLNAAIPAGRSIIFDTAKAAVYFKGSEESLMRYLTIESDFSTLDPAKDHEVSVTADSGNLTATMFFAERYVI